MITEGTEIAGRYRLEALLGEGGMGKVFSARRLADGATVAVKVVLPEVAASPEMRRRFEREARALAALQHPNVIGVLESGEIGDSLFLVMELLHGESLGAYLENNAVDPDTALVIADQMLAGLAFAHAHGVLHRDIKPDNLFVATYPNGSRVIKLLDFGLVKFLDSSALGEQTTLTQQGSIFGSPPYMAPEQSFGQPVDARADVYAAGVVLFELLTGNWPFYGEDVADLLRAHALEPVPTLESARATLRARPELDGVIQTAMAKMPSGRYADAGEMRQALARVPRPAAYLIR